MAGFGHARDGSTVANGYRARDRRCPRIVGNYRAQIEQCAKLKVELDLIHDAIKTRTKREIATLHGNSFDGQEWPGQWRARRRRRRHRTGHPADSRGVEAIDQAATALSKTSRPTAKLLSEEIQERVVAIFEACNFQDLTGQRISKVMTTMKFIEKQPSSR